MLINRFKKMWKYNNWAWEHILNSVSQLSEADLNLDRGFFWGSIYGTLAHTIGAELFWMERLKGNNPSYLFGADDYPDLNAIIKRRKKVQSEWENYLSRLTDEQCFTPAHYTSTEGEERESLIADIIQHVTNHSTEHRSQLTPVLFELGVPTDELDFIFYCVLVDPT